MSSKAAPLSQIDNKPLRARVLDSLREAIVAGDLKPGQPLLENELAAQLGVSRAPLREAFQILSHEGLVETVAYRGTVVRKLTKQDIEELYSLRCVFEQFAIRRIIAANNPLDVALLRELFDAMLLAAESGDLKQVNLIDRQFHDTLIELSRHQLLHQAWSMVTLRVRQVMALRNRRNSVLTQIAYNHVPIIEAIEAGDEARAMFLIQEHVVSARDLIVEMWDNGDEPTP
ncbi:MAG: GntR family transcriptional regulator [Anaerolineae bacterium]|nr:GntR family transcriptional regulator [Anaerolineae bacterium]